MASDTALAPDFIRFLFSSKTKFDCYFEVGNKSQGKPERIGAVKLMLMAHSEVFRLELEYSDLKEKGDVPVKDVHPDTFKGMLKYIYGHDTTSELCFDEADNLLYVAEKYLMKPFKDKLAVRLMKLLNPGNICSLLNNPACYTHLELNSAITEILRYETDHVLASPQFVSMNAYGFLKILEQDGLAVPEIELWRAALKWAKHKTGSEDGQVLRQQLTGLTQNLRLCTLTSDDVCVEIVPADVLTKNELNIVCQSVGRKRKPEGLNEICDEIVPRKRLRRQHINWRVRDELAVRLMHAFECEFSVCNWTLFTKKYDIELLALVCRTKRECTMNPQNSICKLRCTVTITEVANPDNPASCSANEPPVTVYFSERVQYGLEFKIPLAVLGRNVTLRPNTEYTVRMKLKGGHWLHWNDQSGSSSFGNDELALVLFQDRGSNYYFPATKLQYRYRTG